MNPVDEASGSEPVDARAQAGPGASEPIPEHVRARLDEIMAALDAASPQDALDLVLQMRAMLRADIERRIAIVAAMDAQGSDASPPSTG